MSYIENVTQKFIEHVYKTFIFSRYYREEGSTKVSSSLKGEKRRRRRRNNSIAPSINIFSSTRIKFSSPSIRFNSIQDVRESSYIQILCKKPKITANSRDNTVEKWGEPSDAHQTDNRHNLPISSTSPADFRFWFYDHRGNREPLVIKLNRRT